MGKLYTLTIEELKDGERSILHQENYSSMCILAVDEKEDSCGEIIVNSSIPSIAAMIECSKRVKVAASMALAASLASEVRTGAIEDMLSDSINGGIQ